MTIGLNNEKIMHARINLFYLNCSPSKFFLRNSWMLVHVLINNLIIMKITLLPFLSIYRDC